MNRYSEINPDKQNKKNNLFNPMYEIKSVDVRAPLNIPSLNNKRCIPKYSPLKLTSDILDI